MERKTWRRKIIKIYLIFLISDGHGCESVLPDEAVQEVLVLLHRAASAQRRSLHENLARELHEFLKIEKIDKLLIFFKLYNNIYKFPLDLKYCAFRILAKITVVFYMRFKSVPWPSCVGRN